MGPALCLFLVFAGLCGDCQEQLNYRRTVVLEPGDFKAFVLDALSGEIRARVAVKSSGSPVKVYVVREKDLEPALDRLEKGKLPDRLLASKEATEDAILEAAIPARTAFAIILACAAGKNAEVQLHVTAR